MGVHERYTQASLRTRSELERITQTRRFRELSRLSLPQIEATVDLVARVVPAGSIPRVILNGLAAMPGRKLTAHTARRDMHLLIAGLEDLAVFSTAFAAPAAAIWGYQNLLKLAGKDPESAFPQGTWQFYVNYALREDTARHTCETHGFDTLLNEHDISLSPLKRMAAWLLAAIHCLHQYDDLLRNEWREQVYLRELAAIMAAEPEADKYRRLFRQWSRRRPFSRGQDARPHHTFPDYRRMRFNDFLEGAMADLSRSQRRDWVEQVRQAREHELPAYQRQMSLLNGLVPGRYGEERAAISLEWAQIGLIYQGCYYLIPASRPDGGGPARPETVLAQIRALLDHPAPASTSLQDMTRIQREYLTKLLPQFDPTLGEELDLLNLAPVLFNFDQTPAEQPLAELRQVERGIGSHAMTIIDTGRTFVFDQSHIFFDGAWGAALAEILTNEALSWAVYLHRLPPEAARQKRPAVLSFTRSAANEEQIATAPRVMPEVSAETDAVRLPDVLRLRKLFKLRNDLIHLTVNDILILFRAIHAATYVAGPELIQEIARLASRPETRAAATMANQAVSNAENLNPAILIPVDAGQKDPRERVHPISFIVPLEELDLLHLHREAIDALNAYQHQEGNREEAYQAFDQIQRRYLSALAGCGAVFRQAKEVAAAGESTSVGSIKMLAHLPPALQRLLDNIPGRFDVLNDVIKGREVFSNIGVVAPGSSLTRFLTAKDDNEQKALAWGVITDSDQVMRITLRDFRPHVSLLIEAGQRDLARWITTDYLDSFARHLNGYVHDLHRITMSSRETRMHTES